MNLFMSAKRDEVLDDFRTSWHFEAMLKSELKYQLAELQEKRPETGGRYSEVR
jgi:hypothetical protein